MRKVLTLFVLFAGNISSMIAAPFPLPAVLFPATLFVLLLDVFAMSSSLMIESIRH